jgi:uncharacterized protein YqjF (DUF2071 family)
LTIRYRWMPLSLSFPEVNVRTYVRCGTERGVMFLSLDAESRLAVMVARRQYGLPYHVARMTMRRTISVASRSPDHDTGCERAGSGDPRTTECADGPRVCFVSRRRSRCGLPAELQADYGPTSEEFTAEAGSLDHWLIERYQLFTVDRHRRLAHGIIYHLPWRLQAAEADFQINRLVEPLGLRLPPELPLLHFARETNAVAWRLQGAHTSAGQLIEQ